jgi:hypothetical protein
MPAIVRSWRFATVALTVLAAAVTTTVAVTTVAGAAAPSPTSSRLYPCTITGGPNGDASAIGWLGNGQGATACLGGSFYVPNGIDRTYGFGVYNYTRTTWTNKDGYLPALVTSFTDAGAQVSITNFGDRITIGGHPYVAIYSRVAVYNPTSHPVALNPRPTPGLVPLNTAPYQVAPQATVNHDYVVAEDKFGGTYAWPTVGELRNAGGYDAHFAHMRAFWDSSLAQITQLTLPDPYLADAWKAGFIYTQIDRSGNALDTGTNGDYHQEFEHDVIGILASLFNEGYFSDAHALLDEADRVVGTNTQYSDGTWVYPWLWAVYVEKTGDTTFLAARFSSPGPLGAAQPSIETAAHDIAAARTGPFGIIGETNDIDTHGYWTSDDYEALLGLAGYEYLARVIGDTSEADWASAEYSSLLTAVNDILSATIAKGDLDYIPCSMIEPNTANRCANPEDANWAAPGVFFNWAWNAALLGAPVTAPGNGTMADWIDKTLSYGFGRVTGVLPPNTFGGYPGEGLYSTAYNAAYGAWGLASDNYRDQAILSYEFLIANDQSGPYAWWEGSTAPSTTTPWAGDHPASGGGSSPHSWGIAMGDLGLLDSLVSQRADGTLVVGRGIPDSWLSGGLPIEVSNFPAAGGRRLDVTITARGDLITLRRTGYPARLTGNPVGPMIFELPAFVNNIAATTAGTISEPAGAVTLTASTSSVTVTLDHAP